MDGWNAYIDGYCERIEPGMWAEPLNAITNLAFIIAAVVAWKGISNLRMPIARVLAVNLALIGVGSFLFHTFATRWAALVDVLSIATFVIIYLYGANRHFWHLNRVASLLLTAAIMFVLMPSGTMLLSVNFPFLEASAAYSSIALLIFIYGVLLWRKHPEVGRGLIIGAAILAVSITFRTLDEPLCQANPSGTHMAWHILNSVMLAWMIRVLRCRIVANAELTKSTS